MQIGMFYLAALNRGPDERRSKRDAREPAKIAEARSVAVAQPSAPERSFMGNV